MDILKNNQIKLNELINIKNKWFYYNQGGKWLMIKSINTLIFKKFSIKRKYNKYKRIDSLFISLIFFNILIKNNI